jgi:hypothetical protein
MRIARYPSRSAVRLPARARGNSVNNQSPGFQVDSRTLSATYMPESKNKEKTVGWIAFHRLRQLGAAYLCLICKKT